MALPNGPHYCMPPPYFVLRRIGRVPVDDVGDQEYFIGHFPRVWMSWRPPYARWEKFHMPQHHGLYRFKTKDDAVKYIYAHRDMDGTMIEFVTVE